MLAYRYEVGQRVSARIGSLYMGRGEIVEQTTGNYPPVPMYRVRCEKGEDKSTYPLYEDEVTPENN